MENHVQLRNLDDATDTYRPGACNIGPDEIARRRRAGMAGVGIGVAIAVGLVVVGAPAWTRIAILPPLAGGIISLEQARRRFCVGFADLATHTLFFLSLQSSLQFSHALALQLLLGCVFKLALCRLSRFLLKLPLDETRLLLALTIAFQFKI